MYLSKFPMDTQACPLTVGSLGYTNQDLIFKWSGLEMKELETSQYNITEVIKREKNITDRRERDQSKFSNSTNIVFRSIYFLLSIFRQKVLIFEVSLLPQ